MSRDGTPLDPEERALADALARATPRAGPPPEVDAAILASARRALQAEPAARGRHRRRRRWPAALGVAASLALALGIAWQLRPAPDAIVPAASEGPPVVFDAPVPVPGETMQADAARVPETAALPPGVPPVDPPSVRERAPPMPATTRSVPLAQEDAGEPAAAQVSAARPESRLLPAFEPSPPPTDTAIGRKSIRQETTAGDIMFEHEGLDDEPPATLDSPGTRRAWLDRIRELRDAGELDVARESLGEYRRRYPDLDLPEDLEGLLSE